MRCGSQKPAVSDVNCHFLKKFHSEPTGLKVLKALFSGAPRPKLMENAQGTGGFSVVSNIALAAQKMWHGLCLIAGLDAQAMPALLPAAQ